MRARSNQTLAAAGLIFIYAVMIGFTDNFVKVIASSAGLFQFHATRSAMAFGLVALAVLALRLDIRPRNLRAVAGRSLIHGFAMLLYFAALAFLPVAQVAAGLFTAPIFVLLINRFAFGEPVGPLKILAVALGFAGTLLVLGISHQRLGLISFVPVAAGFAYALGNIATRRWCGGETALTLTTGFFATLGLFGLIGMLLLALVPLPVAEGADGFITRGPVIWPPASFWGWTFVQALGSLVGVSFMVKGYQMVEAAKASVFEYVILPVSAAWSYILWGEHLAPSGWLGIALIFAAGLIISRKSA